MISLEGIDGAGKTTQREMIVEYLKEKGLPFITTREPGGTQIAEKIRELLLSQHDESMDIVAETMLFYAARKQHIEAVIEPHLAKGYIVLCDRFADSTFAYQYAKGIRSHQISDIEKVSIGHFKPDHTLYFDIDIETSMVRAAGRGRLDRMEEEFYANAIKTIEGYKLRVQNDPARFVVIDGKSSPAEVSIAVREAIDKILSH
jgi:dTMP kinase